MGRTDIFPHVKSTNPWTCYPFHLSDYILILFFRILDLDFAQVVSLCIMFNKNFAGVKTLFAIYFLSGY